MTAFDSTLVSASTECVSYICVSYICVSYISQLADRIFISNFTFGWSHIKYSQQFSCFPVWSICVSVLQILCKPHIVIVYCSSVWQIIWRDAEASLHWSLEHSNHRRHSLSKDTKWFFVSFWLIMSGFANFILFMHVYIVCFYPFYDIPTTKIFIH